MADQAIIGNAGDSWLPALARKSEAVVIPLAALVVGLGLFGRFLLTQGKCPIDFMVIVWKGAWPRCRPATCSAWFWRAVLARELTGEVKLLVISNPCFGLDFSAVAEIRARIMAARNSGTAVLLMSEDLDEVTELSDRILVMSEGRIAFETPAATADLATIGHPMGGHA